MPCHWLGMAGLLLLKSGRLIKRRDVETNGILGIVKATFIPSRQRTVAYPRTQASGATNSAANPSARSYPARVFVNRRADLGRHPARRLFVEWPDRCE